MNDFETKLDEIRIRLYEEINGMEKDEIIKQVNAHAKKIAREFGINIEAVAKLQFCNSNH